MTKQRSLHERLETDQALVGLLQTHPNAALAELASICGYDFLFLDGEHGVFTDRDLLEALRTLAGTDTLAMVRLPRHDLQAIGRCLDLGADVIVVPNVTTAEQAEALAGAMVYPPAGTRGFGASLHRVTRYGMDVAPHLNAPRKGAALLVIVESVLGAANAEDILAVEGIDGAIIGPFDLSADVGAAGDFSQREFSQAVSRIERAAAAQDKVLGTAPHPGSPIDALLARGHRLFIVGADMSLIREAMTSQLAQARSTIDLALGEQPRSESVIPAKGLPSKPPPGTRPNAGRSSPRRGTQK